MSERRTALQSYFDSIADSWDGWMDMSVIKLRLNQGLQAFALQSDERVLDVGCGTGNSTRAILGFLGAAGRVTGIDLSPRMIALAHDKNPDPRVNFFTADIADTGLASNGFDRVICYSMWPHVSDPQKALHEISRLLVPGGRLHIWHIQSRQRINEIHANAGATVNDDILVPASTLATLVERADLAVTHCIDNETEYLVSAQKPNSQP